MKRFNLLKKLSLFISLILLSGLAQAQILVSGTDFNPSAGNASRFYIGLDDITQIGFQNGSITSTPTLAPNVNPNVFNVGYYYAITPTPIRLDSTRYQDFIPTDYSYVYSPTATSPTGQNVNILSYSVTGLVPNSAVSVIIDYCSAVKSTYAGCTGQRNEFKAGINLDQYNQLNGNDVTQIGMGQCQSNYTVTGTADAAGNMVFRMNDTKFGSCQAMAIKKIQIMGFPQPAIISTSGTEVCAGEQITVQTTTTYNGTYQWQVDNGSGTFTNISGATNQALLYEVSTTPATYKFKCLVTPLPSGTAIASNVVQVKSITCCVDPVTGAGTSRKTVYYDDFGTLDLSDVTGKTYNVWDYSDITNPKLVTKTTTTPFRWPLTPAPLGATYQATGPLQDGQYAVASYLTATSADGAYAGAQLDWANRVTGPTTPPAVSLDHSGTKAGAALFINCPPSTQGLKLYTRTIPDLCFGKQLFFECWIAVFTNGPAPGCASYSPVDVTIKLTDGSNGANTSSANATATRQSDGGGVWVRVSGSITLGAGSTSVIMDVINNSNQYLCGNDLVIDDIKIMACAPPPLDVYFDIPTLATKKDVCTTSLDLDSKPSALLKSYYSNNAKYLYQWTKTPTDYTSWKNLAVPAQAGETYTIANPSLDAAFAGTVNGDKVYFRVVAASDAIFTTNSNFVAPHYANDNDPCKNYSVSNIIEATVQCPSCSKPSVVTITTPAASPTSICQGTAQTLSGSATVTAASLNGGFTYTWRKVLPTPVGVLVAPTAITFTPNTAKAVPNYTGITGAIADAGTYVLRVEDGSAGNSSCYTEASVVINVNPTQVPSVAIAVAPTGAICAGTSVTFTATPTNGGAAPTYQWKKGGTAIPGATNATYTTTGAANGDSYTVTLTSNALCASPTTATSTAIVMTVNPVLVPSVAIAVAPTGAICAGTSVTFTATPTNGGAAPTYQWKKGGTAIPGATNATYTTTGAANGDSYTVTLTSNALCASPATATSTAIVMTVNPVLVPSVAVAVAPTGAICAGTSVTFTATPANGGTAPTYQWKKGGTAIAGETNATYTTTGAANGDSYTVTLTSNALCASPATATSTAIVMTVNPILVPGVAIAVAPTGAICAGTSVTFTATPTNGGAAPTYQWKKGGTAIPGATNATYTTAAAANGDSYTVTLTSNAPCVSPATATSTAIVMTVNPVLPVSVSIATPSTTICAGTSVTFTATPANGGGAPTYVWKKGGATIAGATNATYTTTAAANGDSYTVVMTSNATCPSGNPATSNAVVITVTTAVTPAVSITAAPAGAICAGTSVTFTASPGNGGTSPTYQWKKGGVAITGETNVTYTSTTLANGDQISVDMVSNSGCAITPNATSNVITMVVNPVLVPAVAIAVSPTGAICPGTSITFTATPTNGGTPTYQWRKNTVNIASATNATFTTTTAANNDSYDVVMTSNATCANPATATSTPIVITVTPVPAIAVSIAPDVTSICANNPVQFTATVSGSGSTPAPKYEWFVTSAATATGGTSQGAPSTTATTFTTSALTATNNKVYVQVVSNATCAAATAVASNVVAITVNAGIGAGTIGSDQTICYNTTPAAVTETAAPAGIVGTPTYTWEGSLTGSAPFTTIPGATNSSYTSPIAITQDVYVRRVITDPGTPAPCNVATSNAIHITVRPQLVAGVVGSDETMCSGAVPAAMTQTTAPTGGTGTYTYQWQSDASGSFQNIVGATNSGYTSAALTATTQFQRVETSGTCGSVTGNIVTKTITAKEVVTVSINDPGQVCDGSAAFNFAATASTTGTGTLSYAWFLNSTPVGTNSANYSYSPVIGDNGKTVKVIVSTSNGCNAGAATSNLVTLNIVGATTPTVAITTNNNPNCAGLLSTFTATSTGGGTSPSYQWYVNSNTNPVGTGGTTYSSSTLANGDQVYVELTSSLGCLIGTNPFTSNKITMVIKPIPAPVITDGNQTVCSPATFTFHGVVGTGTTLQWKLNNQDIAGATNANYTATQSGTYTLYEDNGTCNSTSAPVTLNVVQTPVANAGSDIYIKEGDAGSLNGSGGAVYSWSPATYLSSTAVSNPTFTATQTTTYTLTVSDASSTCSSTDDVTVFVVSPVEVPNVITVNGDGTNDDWEIKNIEGYPNVIIEIYNRWGNLVWKTEGYPKNWDGTNFRNGQVLSEGTYFYIINLHSQLYDEPLTGWVQIIK